MSELSDDGGPGSFRDRVHGLLRDSILDAAWSRAQEVTWSQVRIADIAKDVGVSRQTIYNEFGTKDQLSLALFNRELDRFLTELETQIRSAAKVTDAVRNGIRWMLEETTGNKMVARLVRDAKAGLTDGLIPILTVRSDLIIVPVRTRLAEVVAERWPEADHAATELLADLYVRFVLGQVVTPTDLDTDLMVEALVAMAMRIEIEAGSRS